MRKATLVSVLLLLQGIASAAPPPVPSGAHPRLFMSAQEIAGYTSNAKNSSSDAAAQVAACQDTIDNPSSYTSRGGSDGNYWPGSAVACAFAWRATQNSAYLTQAIKYWQASLDDDQTIGDKAGCVAGVSADWQSWAMSGNGSAPAVLRTVTHDTGYAMRWYGPDIALTYDWLHDAPGVSAGLLSQTQVCLTNWNDWYSQYGYHHDQAGANYNAGFVVAKALSAIAIGNDGGADGHLWNEVLTNEFGKVLIGDGLAGAQSGVGTAAGAMLGGDWLEGWQYGELSVLEYAVAARALEESGAALPEMDAWASSLVVRYLYGTVPQLDGQWVGGDFDSSNVYQTPSASVLDAVLAGPSSDQAASWALWLKQQQKPHRSGFVYSAIAELRAVTAADYRAQSPAPPLWYLSRGSRTMYVRSDFSATAFWGVFSSPPHIVDDHEHFAASNFVLSRGGDHLIVDPSEYGAENTIETNAVSADSPSLMGDLAKTQSYDSKAELAWARASDSNVFAARSDLANAFLFQGTSDIPYAHREWVFLPEGEVIAIDRVDTADASHVMYVNFHANTGGQMTMANGVASGTVGGSRVVIHPVHLSGGTPAITAPAAISTDYGSCPGNYPNGPCNDARFAVDIYALQVPGPHATAVHVIDALGTSESPADVHALGDSTIDPGAQNGGVIGAAVTRGKRSYVVASSAPDGAAGATLTYGVPGDAAARHIVFDAPEAADGTSHVATAVVSGRCVVTITAGTGGGFAGHPLMFGVDSAQNACAATDGADAPSAMPPMGGGPSGGSDGGTPGGGGGGDGGAPMPGGPNNNHGAMTGGCTCSVTMSGNRDRASLWPLALTLLAAIALIRRSRRARTQLDPREGIPDTVKRW
jgi:hypothetical protein